MGSWNAESTICPFGPEMTFSSPKHYVLKGKWPVLKRKILESGGKNRQKDKWYPFHACTGGGGASFIFMAAGIFLNNRQNRQSRQNRHGCLFVLYFVGPAKRGQGALQIHRNGPNLENRHEGCPPLPSTQPPPLSDNLRLGVGVEKRPASYRDPEIPRKKLKNYPPRPDPELLKNKIKKY